jgi:hypothetical protein
MLRATVSLGFIACLRIRISKCALAGNDFRLGEDIKKARVFVTLEPARQTAGCRNPILPARRLFDVVSIEASLGKL